MDAQLVRNLNCAIQDIVYKRAYHSQYGMDCKIAPPCLLVNLLLVGQSGCTIPDEIQCETDKLRLTNYPAIVTSITISCNTTITVQQLPPLTPITVETI